MCTPLNDTKPTDYTRRTSFLTKPTKVTSNSKQQIFDRKTLWQFYHPANSLLYMLKYIHTVERDNIVYPHRRREIWLSYCILWNQLCSVISELLDTVVVGCARRIRFNDRHVLLNGFYCCVFIQFLMFIFGDV